VTIRRDEVIDPDEIQLRLDTPSGTKRWKFLWYESAEERLRALADLISEISADPSVADSIAMIPAEPIPTLQAPTLTNAASAQTTGPAPALSQPVNHSEAAAREAKSVIQ